MQTGVDERLRTLIDGEALINDGSAYVLFILLRTLVEGGHETGMSAIRTVAQLSLGGPAVGLGIAFATTIWLRWMFNNLVGEITLTIVAAFGAYLIADQFCKVRMQNFEIQMNAFFAECDTVQETFLSCTLLSCFES